MKNKKEAYYNIIDLESFITEISQSMLNEGFGSPKFHLLIRLRFIQKMTIEDIAKTINRSTSTTKNHIKSAERTIRAYIKTAAKRKFAIDSLNDQLKIANDKIKHLEGAVVMSEKIAHIPNPKEYKLYVVDMFDISVRAINIIKQLDVRNFYDLVNFHESDLRSVRNCGKKTVNEIKVKMAEYGLKLITTLPEKTKNK